MNSTHQKNALLVLILVANLLPVPAQSDDSISDSSITVIESSRTLAEEGLKANDPGLAEWYTKFKSLGLPLKEIEHEVATAFLNTKITLSAAFDTETRKWKKDPKVEVHQPSPISFSYPLKAPSAYKSLLKSAPTTNTFTSSSKIIVSTISKLNSSINRTESGDAYAATYRLDVMIRTVNIEKNSVAGKIKTQEFSMKTEGNWELNDIEITLETPAL